MEESKDFRAGFLVGLYEMIFVIATPLALELSLSAGPLNLLPQKIQFIIALVTVVWMFFGIVDLIFWEKLVKKLATVSKKSVRE